MLELPDQTAVPGPVQVHQTMTNNADDPAAAQPAVRRNQAQVLYGNLLSLPFGDGMLYVEPVYVKSNQENAYPLLQKVLMSYGDGGTYVVLADTLDTGHRRAGEAGQADACAATDGRTAGDTAAGDAAVSVAVRDGGADHATPPSRPATWPRRPTGWRRRSRRCGAAQASGDPARWGRAIEALDDAMRELRGGRRAAVAFALAEPGRLTPTATRRGSGGWHSATGGAGDAPGRSAAGGVAQFADDRQERRGTGRCWCRPAGCRTAGR